MGVKALACGHQPIGRHVPVVVSSPGSYNPEKKPPLKVAWPMQFGSPDWAQVPCLQKRTLKTEVIRLDFCRALCLVVSCISGILDQESVNELDVVLGPLPLNVCLTI